MSPLDHLSARSQKIPSSLDSLSYSECYVIFTKQLEFISRLAKAFFKIGLFLGGFLPGNNPANVQIRDAKIIFDIQPSGYWLFKTMYFWHQKNSQMSHFSHEKPRNRMSMQKCAKFTWSSRIRKCSGSLFFSKVFFFVLELGARVDFDNPNMKRCSGLLSCRRGLF